MRTEAERRFRESGGARRDRRRLDTPRSPTRAFRPHYDPELFGRFAETFARFMGTARFIAYMTVFVIIWVTLNLVAIFGLQWDPYPFILLNLFFSTQASYAAPLILLAQNRQEARDRVQYDQDRDMNVRTRADIEFLAREVASLRLAVGEVATRDFLRSELRSLLTDLEELQNDGDGDHVRADTATRPGPAGGQTSRTSRSRGRGGRDGSP
ncbi:DUF1003 domain-containing protein [Actinopolymorpha rutila]|uniref:DUF1003 domain-containing protein n=1 Tax=Actinopolymorpha rutila TaxID=446787 RepID=UPI00192DF637